MDTNSAEAAADSSLSSSFDDSFADGHYDDLSILDGLLHYTGNIVNKQFEGEGILKSTREVYKGGFKANKYSGHGEWHSTISEHPSGVVSYEGGWEDGHYAGQGTIVFSNGDRYSGPFSHGAPDGEGGTYTYQDGRVYVGAFAEGLRHGRGRLTQPGGADFFDGSFDHGVISGYGEASYNHGARLFKGTWKDGHKVEGTMTFPGSARFYKGHWLNDLPDGAHGAMEFANGDRYEGDFCAGKLQGIGHLTYTTPAGKWYYGQFLKDHPHGQGFLYFPPEGEPDKQRGTLVEGCFAAGALVAATDTASLARVREETASLPALGPLPRALRALTDPEVHMESAASSQSQSSSTRSPPPDELAPSLSTTAAPAPAPDGSVVSSTPATPLTPAAASCKGWLEKYSIGRSKLAMASNWKRRFFILAPFNDIVCLGYYEDELCEKPIGLLRLNPNKTRVVSLPSARTHKKASKPGREVCIIYDAKGKEYKLLLRAADSAEHHRWLVALRQCFHTFDLATDAPLDPSKLHTERH